MLQHGGFVKRHLWLCGIVDLLQGAAIQGENEPSIHPDMTSGRIFVLKRARKAWNIRPLALQQRILNFTQPVRALQHFAGLGAVGGAHDAVALHQVNEVGSAAVADAQPPLQQRG